MDLTPEPKAAPTGNLLQQLQTAEARYRSLFGLNPDPIYVLDQDGLIVSGNNALETLTGHALPELLLRPFTNLLVPEDREHAMRHFRRAAGGIAQVYEVTGVSREGREFHLAMTTFPLVENGEAVGVYGIGRDITEQKEAERALRDSEERYRLLADNVQDLISLHDLEGRFLYASPSAHQLLGYHPVELIGRSVYDLALPQDQAALRSAHRDILARNGKAPLAFRIRRADGSVGWFEATARMTEPLPPDGERRIVGLARDISERRALEHRLLQSEKMEAVGRLAAGIAHDFNNLLTVISGRAQIALGRAGSGPIAEDLDGVLEAARRASALVTQLMTFGRTLMSEPQPVDLNAVILELHAMVNRLLREDIRLVTQLEPKLWPVRLDPAQVEQVILNLVVNARDAMPAGGMIGVTTENIGVKHASSSLPELVPGEYVLLTVLDTGHGIEEAVLPHIFEPFFASGEGAGAGLGLATVYRIAREAGGDVEVESVPGSGTAFRLYLPRTHADGEAERVVVSETVPPNGDETVLLVEDDLPVRSLVQAILERFGYRVVAAASGQEALRLSDAFPGPVDLLISDVMMPGMRGPEVAALLQQRRPGLPVLFISGYSEDAIARQGLAGGVEYLAKPFRPEHLARRVREILDAAGTPAR